MGSFSADFEHTYAGGFLRTSVAERGTVEIKKPGMMRWRYTWPEEKLFVSDGVSLYSYIPADRQVIVGAVPAGDSVSTPALFLAGRGRLVEDFVVAWDDGADTPPQGWSLRLTPVRDDSDYVRLELLVDRRDPELHAAPRHRPAGRRLHVYLHQPEGERTPAGLAVRLRGSGRRRCNQRGRAAPLSAPACTGGAPSSASTATCAPSAARRSTTLA